MGLALILAVFLVGLTGWKMYRIAHDSNRKLREALQRNNLGGVEAAFEKGADVHAETDELELALINSYGPQVPKALDALIQHGLDINRLARGETLVQRAVEDHNPTLAVALIEKGARLTPKDDGAALLLQVVQYNSNDNTVAFALLDKGLNPNMKHGQGTTPLDAAAGNSNWALCRRLLEKGATPDKKSASNLLVQAINGKRDQIAILALQHGANPNSRPNHNRPALAIAVENDNLELAKELLARGVSPNVMDGNPKRGGLPVIYDAVTFDNPKMVRLLLAHGANVRSASGLTAIARTHSRPDIEKMLLAAGAKK